MYTSFALWISICIWSVYIFVDIAHIVNTLLHILVHVYMFKFVLIVNKLSTFLS